jgi:hypothetical protein
MPVVKARRSILALLHHKDEQVIGKLELMRSMLILSFSFDGLPANGGGKHLNL